MEIPVLDLSRVCIKWESNQLAETTKSMTYDPEKVRRQSRSLRHCHASAKLTVWMLLLVLGARRPDADALDSSFKCNTQRPWGIGCCDG